MKRTSRALLALAFSVAAAAWLASCGVLGGKPKRIAIAYTNDVRGEIRSCGCATHDLGGLGRRATFMRVFRDTTEADVLLVDAGDFFAASINYGKEKAELTMKSMAHMHYDGLVPGENEFGFGADYFRTRAREVGLPVLAVNVADAVTDSLLFAPSRVVTMKSGLRAGIIGVVSPALKFPPQVHAGSLEIRDPVSTVQAEVDALRPDVDVVVVLSHMTRSEVNQFAQALKGVDVIVNGHDGLPVRQVKRWGEPYVVQVAAKGMYVGVASGSISKEKRVVRLSNDVVGLDKSYGDDEAIAKLFNAYDMQVVAREKAALPTHAAVTFAGAGACQACHAPIFEKWKASPHAHAFERLASQNRQFDRDCTPCHTTGFFKQGGFVNASATPHLADVQCEACHGNGSIHAKDPKQKTDTVAKTSCRICHTAEQTPDFEFDTFWARIDHGGAAASSAGSR
ncbi:MAG TPA: multiheme c-type cytochrome [Candidatus Krumholzibacteria bacterium]|nr:multiheme c-type cytochrome [Candidatus Krumholzibacteria bacterium]